MSLKRIAFFAVLLIVASASHASAQSGGTIMQFANKWLFTSCADAERIDSAAHMFKAGGATTQTLQDYFLYRFQTGMPPSDSARLLANEEYFYHIQPGHSSDMATSHPSTLATVAEANMNYRIRALAGLASCRTAASKQVIDSLAAMPSSPFQQAAKRFQ